MRALGTAMVLSCILAFYALAAGQPGPRPAVAHPTHDPAVDYVGTERCKVCHFGIATTFAGTGMGRSFYPMSDAVAVEDFTQDNELLDESSGLRYRMFRKDGRYYQRQFLRDSQGRETAAVEHELAWVVGSNNHGRGYFIEQRNRLFQAPVCWDPTTGDWMLCPGFETANEHFGREVGHTCVFCHNGRMERVAETRNAYKPPLAHGIGCERCHGPGQLHVERYLGEGTVDAIPAGTDIVNPRRLPRTERIQVCFQCHLGDSSATERVVRRDRELESFRPGEPLTEVVMPFRYVEPTRHDFGIASQADRLLLSRCYNESDGKLECLTCHNPHITVYRDSRPADFFTSRCAGCHETNDCLASEETRRGTEPPDDCVACHMRRAEAVDRKHAIFTDHWIRRRIDIDQPDRRENFDLAPVFPAAFAALSPGEAAYCRGRANFLRHSTVPPPARPLLLERAEQAFLEAIGAGYDNADSRFFLGKTYVYMRRWDRASLMMRKALKHEPGHHDAAFAEGQILAGRGDFGAALEIFAAMLARRPDDPMALAEYGRCLWQSGRATEALEAYDRAIELEPWNASLELNRGMILAGRERFSEAARAAERTVELAPNRLDGWAFYERVMRLAGRERLADEALLRIRRLEGKQ